jgi:DNA-directed RNA polymerase specialized sigma24 family protein
LHQEKALARGTSAYAVAGDFCRIFANEMKRLYLLSFLLTSDHGKAEQCFVSGLEDCLGTNHVFRDWASLWARRAIIRNAIRIVQPGREQAKQSSIRHSETGAMAAADNDAPFAPVLGLDPLERFVFVLTVLESYSDQDCRMLLQCSRQEVAQARSRAMELIARFAGTPPLPAIAGAGEAFAQAG